MEIRVDETRSVGVLYINVIVRFIRLIAVSDYDRFEFNIQCIRFGRFGVEFRVGNIGIN